MNQLKRAETYLINSQNADGGWGYHPGRDSSLEPTVYAALALHGTGGGAADGAAGRALAWLASRRKANGALALPGQQDDHWSTLPYLLTLVRVGAASDVIDQVARWALDFQSSSPKSNRLLDAARRVFGALGSEGNNEADVKLDHTLVGWGWAWSTFGWVEPTSHALLSLKLAGRSEHPRIREGARLLLDRACLDGGWNYGNREVLGQPLTSYVPTTALATLALQNDETARPAIERGLAYIQREIQANQSTFNLALAILCFDAFALPTASLPEKLLRRQTDSGDWRDNVHLTAVAALALRATAATAPPMTSSGGANVFRLS